MSHKKSNAKGIGSVVPVHSMKVYGGVEAYVRSFITVSLDVNVQLVLATLPCGKSPWIQGNWKVGDPHRWPSPAEIRKPYHNSVASHYRPTSCATLVPL
jgi:hypothetical protein